MVLRLLLTVRMSPTSDGLRMSPVDQCLPHLAAMHAPRIACPGMDILQSFQSPSKSMTACRQAHSATSVAISVAMLTASIDPSFCLPDAPEESAFPASGAFAELLTADEVLAGVLAVAEGAPPLPDVSDSALPASARGIYLHTQAPRRVCCRLSCRHTAVIASESTCTRCTHAPCAPLHVAWP